MKLVLASKNKKEAGGDERDPVPAWQSRSAPRLRRAWTWRWRRREPPLRRNSLLKARAVMEASGLPAIADDSGLCVDALGGAPGVYSCPLRRRGLDDIGGYWLLLENMKGQMPRTAKLVSRYHLLFPQRRRDHRTGESALAPSPSPPGGGRLRL